MSDLLKSINAKAAEAAYEEETNRLERLLRLYLLNNRLTDPVNAGPVKRYANGSDELILIFEGDRYFFVEMDCDDPYLLAGTVLTIGQAAKYGLLSGMQEEYGEYKRRQLEAVNRRQYAEDSAALARLVQRHGEDFIKRVLG